MIERKKLSVNEAAKQLRDLTIERNIVHLKSQIAQQEASELYNRTRKLDHEVMCASGDLSRAATADVPEIFHTNIGADNEAAKQMIAKLVLLREEKEYPRPQVTIQLDKNFDIAAAMKESFSMSIGLKPEDRDATEYMAKRFAERHSELQRLTAGELDQSEALVVKTQDNEDVSPWDSTIE